MINKDDPKLTALVLGELDEAESKKVQAEVDRSPELQAEVLEIRETVSLMEVQFAAEPVESLTDAQREAILLADPEGCLSTSPSEEAKLQTRLSGSTSATRLTRRTWVGILLVASLCLVLASFGDLFSPWTGGGTGDSLVENAQGSPPGDSTQNLDVTAGEVRGDTVLPESFFFEAASESAKRSSETWDAYVQRLARRGYVTEEEVERWRAGESISVSRERVDSIQIREAGKKLAESRKVLAARIDERDETDDGRGRKNLGEPLLDSSGDKDGDVLPALATRDGAADFLKPNFESLGVEFGVEPRPGLRTFTIPAPGTEPESAILLAFSDLPIGANGVILDESIAGFDRRVASVEPSFGRKVDRLDGQWGWSLEDDRRSSDAREIDDQLTDLSRLYFKRPLRELTASKSRDEVSPPAELGLALSDRFQNESDEQEPFDSYYLYQLYGVPGQKEQATVIGGLFGMMLEQVDPAGTKEVELRRENDRLELYVEGDKAEETPSVKAFLRSIKLSSIDSGLEARGKFEKEDLESQELQELNRQLKQRLRQPSTESIVTETLSRRNRAIASKRSWKRVAATANTSRLLVGDKDELKMQGLQANVLVDGFRARVLLDCFFYNDRAEQLEGNFKLRLPDDASLYYFAFGASSQSLMPQGKLASLEFIEPKEELQFASFQAVGIAEKREAVWEEVKEAKMVPRGKAAFAYKQTVQKKVDPALVEWNGAGVFSARVFPLMPSRMHRIVIGYDVDLTPTDTGMRFQLDLPQELGECRVDLQVAQSEAATFSVHPEVEAKDLGGHDRYTWTNSKLGAARSIELQVETDRPLLLQSSETAGEIGQFWATRVKLDLPEQPLVTNEHAIFMLDNSLSSNPDKFNVWLQLLRETLERNRRSLKQFGVLVFDVENYFWEDHYVENTAENVERLMEDLQQLALEGATDLNAAVERLAQSPWVVTDGMEPDLFLLSDGAATWGEADIRLIQNRLERSQLGRLFAYQTGLNGTAISELRWLADRSGGAVFSVASEAEIARAATAHQNRSWKIKSMNAQGTEDVMTAGRLSWAYPGQVITVVGRGTVDNGLELVLEQDGVEKRIRFDLQEVIESELAARLYGHVAVGQLERLGASVEDVATAYARHFRITGQTCSLLMLESKEDYERFGISPAEDGYVVNSKLADPLVAETLKTEAKHLKSPKAHTLEWVEGLVSIPGIEYEMPTALKLAIEKANIGSISQPLQCEFRRKSVLDAEYLRQLESGKLDYDSVIVESKRRQAAGVDDSIKALSNLIEQSPGDLVLTRNLAFVAMELDLPAAAYHLFRRVSLARPFESTAYLALGKCLTQLGEADMAILYYEIALEAKFSNVSSDFREIVSTEYRYLLRQIEAGKLKSAIPEYVSARLRTLEEQSEMAEQDLIVTLVWNTDQSDVDLHVVEPSGEVCFYKNPQTQSGGRMTQDVTTGFGPEMYRIKTAVSGKYKIRAKYYGNRASRTSMRNQVLLTVYRNYGKKGEQIYQKRVELEQLSDVKEVMTIEIDLNE